MNYQTIITITLCLLTMIGRIFVPHVVPSPPGTYQAFVHVFCGILLTLWWLGRGRFYLISLVTITTFELVMFFFFQ